MLHLEKNMPKTEEFSKLAMNQNKNFFFLQESINHLSNNIKLSSH